MNDGIRGLPPRAKHAFSKSATLVSPTAATVAVVWQVTMPCDAVRIAATRNGGTVLSVNASHGTVTAPTTGQLLTTALVTSADLWTEAPGGSSGIALMNNHFEPGDNLLFNFGAPTGTVAFCTIQVDFLAAP